MTPEELAAAIAEAERLTNLAAADEATDEQKAAAEKALAEVEKAKEEIRKKAELDAQNPAPTDDAAKLLKEVMKWKEKARLAEARAKLFDGIDPAKAKAALDAHAEAERKEMEARGEYDRILAQVNETHAQEISTITAERDGLKTQIEALSAAGREKDTANLFANSSFVRDNLTISGAKVRVLFGDHFDWQGDDLVAYDKPKGAKERTPLVDGQGKNLSFDAALEKVIKADPEWEKMAKSKLRPGSGSNPSNLEVVIPEGPLSSTDKIKAGLGSLKKTNLNLRRE